MLGIPSNEYGDRVLEYLKAHLQGGKDMTSKYLLAFGNELETKSWEVVDKGIAERNANLNVFLSVVECHQCTVYR